MSSRRTASSVALLRTLKLCARGIVTVLLVAAAAQARAAYEQLILDISVNGQPRGEFTVYRAADGDFLVREVDLPALGIAPQAGPMSDIDGQKHLSLRSLGPSTARYDERRLALEIVLATQSLRASGFDLQPRRPDGVLEPRQTSAIVNYRLSALDAGTPGPIRTTLANEIALRVGDLLFRNEASVTHDGAVTRGIRFATQAIYDRQADQQRWILGDHVGVSGELGSSLPVGGLNFAKVYQMAPYLVRQPLAGFAGTASTPSQVEVRLGGVPVFRETVAPGPFELRNLQQYGGARDVEVIVRDALGREQSYGFPFYFSDQALAQGLHEYSYSLGKLRMNLGTESNRYGETLFTAFHRYGWNDALTVGLRGEAGGGISNAGPTLLYRSDRLGALSAAVSFSERAGRHGTASSLNYQYQAPEFGVRALSRQFSTNYATMQELLTPLEVRADYGIGGSLYSRHWGSVSADRLITQRRAAPTTYQTRLNYTYSLAAFGSFFATLTRVHETDRSTEAFIGLLITLDRDTTFNASARRDRSGAHTDSLQLVRSVPTGEGTGYRIAYERTHPGDIERLPLFVQHNAAGASFIVDAVADRIGGASTERVELAVQGAAVYVGGAWNATRQIQDSFVAVQLASPLEGVRIYNNNQEAGRTDSTGRLIVPNVGAFVENQVTVEEKDVPLDYQIGVVRQLVAPPFRSGSLIAFDVRRMRAVEGVIRIRARGAIAPADNTRFRLVRDGRAEEHWTGRDGRYYIEDLAPGRYDASLMANGKECRFVVVVPQSAEAIQQLADVVACD